MVEVWRDKKFMVRGFRCLIAVGKTSPRASDFFDTVVIWNSSVYPIRESNLGASQDPARIRLLSYDLCLRFPNALRLTT